MIDEDADSIVDEETAHNVSVTNQGNTRGLRSRRIATASSVCSWMIFLRCTDSSNQYDTYFRSATSGSNYLNTVPSSHGGFTLVVKQGNTKTVSLCCESGSNLATLHYAWAYQDGGSAVYSDSAIGTGTYCTPKVFGC